jgi:hypothetical protein
MSNRYSRQGIGDQIYVLYLDRKLRKINSFAELYGRYRDPRHTGQFKAIGITYAYQSPNVKALNY